MYRVDSGNISPRNAVVLQQDFIQSITSATMNYNFSFLRRSTLGTFKLPCARVFP